MKPITPTFGDSGERSGIPPGTYGILLGTCWHTNSRFARQPEWGLIDVGDYHDRNGFRLYKGIR
jgi:hypothetical protein